MTAPPLNDGEHILFNHVPSLRAYKRTALLMIAVTLPAVVAFLFVFPDTFWPAVPLFVTCFLLMQERFTLGRHRAWITNQRIIFQGGRVTPLADVAGATKAGNGVRLMLQNGGKGEKLSYPEDAKALIATLDTARKEQADAV